mmetsp:Transcript_79863/g.140940  ORF Transcript_79863/g.140940 Transcript_79863/m.140940 type:complete len:278 (+) Transcript_79863:207-1040(+)
MRLKVNLRCLFGELQPSSWIVDTVSSNPAFWTSQSFHRQSEDGQSLSLFGLLSLQLPHLPSPHPFSAASGEPSLCSRRACRCLGCHWPACANSNFAQASFSSSSAQADPQVPDSGKPPPHPSAQAMSVRPVLRTLTGLRPQSPRRSSSSLQRLSSPAMGRPGQPAGASAMLQVMKTATTASKASSFVSPQTGQFRLGKSFGEACKVSRSAFCGVSGCAAQTQCGSRMPSFSVPFSCNVRCCTARTPKSPATAFFAASAFDHRQASRGLLDVLDLSRR